MRKRCKRVHRRVVAPTMVAMHLNPEINIQERMSVAALRGGWATTDHFNLLADCPDMLILAANEKNDQAAIAACDLAGIALMNMKDRHAKLGKIGATGDELQALDLLHLSHVTVRKMIRAGTIKTNEIGQIPIGEIDRVLQPRAA